MRDDDDRFPETGGAPLAEDDSMETDLVRYNVDLSQALCEEEPRDKHTLRNGNDDSMELEQRAEDFPLRLSV